MAGKSFQDRELAARVRLLRLNNAKKSLKKERKALRTSIVKIGEFYFAETK